MTNADKEKTKNEKYYFIPMEVTAENIKAFNLKAKEII